MRVALRTVMCASLFMAPVLSARPFMQSMRNTFSTGTSSSFNGTSAQATDTYRRAIELSGNLTHSTEEGTEFNQAVGNLREVLSQSGAAQKKSQRQQERANIETAYQAVVAAYASLTGDSRGQDQGQRTEQRQGQRTEQRQGQCTEQRQGQRTEQRQGQCTEQRQGQRTEQRQGQCTEQRQGQRTEQRQGQRTEQRQGQCTEQRQGQRTEQRQGQCQVDSIRSMDADYRALTTEMTRLGF